ncbi:hypothetical protein EsDP_00001946 [Epichloe bromicola]|uniref:SCP domain-containing protein n=1 Tax=Epichloe bromicola TaxID=79588 RepID=A0ABQ0CJB1_9HYPO
MKPLLCRPCPFLPFLLQTSSRAAPDIVTVTVTVTAAPAIASDEPQWGTTQVFASAILNSTNFYRRQHNASDVAWNKTLADFAGRYLDGSDCRFGHSGGPYGENLAEGYPSAAASVEGWGEERNRYSFDKAEFSHETGHFTQLVWKSTTAVGCGRRLCGRSGWYLACEYWPRGNVVGQFAEQVSRAESGGEVLGPGTLLLSSLGVLALLASCWE